MNTAKDAPKSRKFDIYGINHLALTCGDMKRTVDFYSGVLGLPLVKTLQIGGGAQHFFFDISEGNGLAFFWRPKNPDPAPGLANAGWDPVTGAQVPVSAIGSMHHLAFDVPLDKLEEYRDRLRAAGIEVTELSGTATSPDGEQETTKSIYFPDPDGFVLGFAAWTRPLTPDDVQHEPASVPAVAAKSATREQAAAANA